MKLLVPMCMGLILASCQSTNNNEFQNTVTIPDSGNFSDLNLERNGQLTEDIAEVKTMIEQGLKEKKQAKYQALLEQQQQQTERCEDDSIENLAQKEQCLTQLYNEQLQQLHVFVANSGLKNIGWFHISSVETDDYLLSLDGYYYYSQAQSRLKLFIPQVNIERNDNDNQHIVEVVRSFDLALYKKPFNQDAKYVKLGEYKLNTIIDRFSTVNLQNLSFELVNAELDYSSFEVAAAVHMANHDVEASTSRSKLKSPEKLAIMPKEKPIEIADDNADNPWVDEAE